ncbi:MAG: WbuC family cupin fold metalloprotein [Cyanobacteriota bacterium]|nr:WbuC family cupin fold metalloprotein [Cyanobacteriota bacterium]
MRITIVGCGYVGQALARHWMRRGGTQLTVTTTSEQRRAELAGLAQRVLVLRADDPAALRHALAEAQVAVFTLAPTGDRPVDAAAYASTYSDSFRALQEVATDLPGLRQIVYTSSCSVYGDSGGDWVDETTPVTPRDDHGEVLLESEALLASLRRPGRSLCVLRLGALYGPGRELTRRLRRLVGTTRPGRGAGHCHWIHRDDVVRAIDAAVEGAWDEVVNLVDDRAQTMAGMMKAFCEASGEPPVIWDPTAAQGSVGVDRRISNERLKTLGFSLRHPEVRFASLRPIDQILFDRVAAEAGRSPRLRRHHSFHDQAERVQRFLNVLQPGTYVRPHCHRRHNPSTGFECLVVLQGALGLLVFDDHGQVLETWRLEAGGPTRGVELGGGMHHTLVALSPDTVILEVKQGPYRAASDKDFLEGFPEEGTPQAVLQEAEWRELYASV